MLRYASENVFVPLTVGGGIRDFTDGNGQYVLCSLSSLKEFDFSLFFFVGRELIVIVS